MKEVLTRAVHGGPSDRQRSGVDATRLLGEKAALCVGISLTLIVGSAASAADFGPAAVKEAVDKTFGATYPRLEALYKDLHRHPELGFQENRTATELAAAMRSVGFQVTEHVGKTGIVAIYTNGAGPTVLVRTELDALPMQEKTGLTYAGTDRQMWEGKETYVDHSCGHDIHMAAWVGAAEALLAMKTHWRGTLMFIGQPSEESLGGAKAMLDDKLFQRFGKPDYGFALHVAQGPYGTVMYKPGAITSNSDSLEIRFNGRGGHGSMPNLAIDPVMMAARFVVDVQSIVSREKNPAAFGVITIGSVHGGTAGNIIPDDVVLRGTIRSYSEDVRKGLVAGAGRTARAVAQMADAAAPEVSIVESAKAVLNEPTLTEHTAREFRIAFGDNAIQISSPSAASEDFSDFVAAGVPSMFFVIGGFDPAQIAAAKAGGVELPVNHSPLFAPIPEPTIRTGVEAMTLSVIGVLARP